MPADVFEPATSRLIWLPVHVALIAAGTVLVASGIPVWASLLTSLAIGVSFAGLAFVAHEALHGALCRRRRLRKFVGFVGFLPFCISPRLWIAWHNRVHHGATNHVGRDPDAIASIDEYRNRLGTRVSANIQRTTRGVVTLLIGFTVQSSHTLLVAQKKNYLPARHHRRAVLETLGGWAFWITLGVLLGPAAFLWAFVVPLLVANAIVMAHILTNHGLCPTDETNNPLKGSLSVTVPAWFSWLTLGFGYHVEHHLFPAMSHRHGPRVSRWLRRHYPDQYQHLPLVTALVRVCRNPRVYQDATTLVDPRTGVTEKVVPVCHSDDTTASLIQPLSAGPRLQVSDSKSEEAMPAPPPSSLPRRGTSAIPTAGSSAQGVSQ